MRPSKVYPTDSGLWSHADPTCQPATASSELWIGGWRLLTHVVQIVEKYAPKTSPRKPKLRIIVHTNEDMEPIPTTLAGVAPMVAGHAKAELGDFDTLMRAEQRRIYRVLLAMLRDPDAADTLTQECFLKAYENRKRFRGECSTRTWLIRIAVNLAKDHLKSGRRKFWQSIFRSAGSEEMVEPADPRATPEQGLLVREKLDAVWSVVASLPTQQRAIWVLRFVEEMSIEEIATATALRPGTVKAHLFRALGTIRQRMTEGG